MNRLRQATLIFCILFASWLAMQGVHELGHVFGAWWTGGSVTRVVWHPLTLSRTDVAVNPHPLTVAWAGPLFGIAAPLVLWLVWLALRLPAAFVLRFFAGFCLIANGAYIGGASFDAVGDAGDMLRHGSPLWLLWLFGALTVPAGLLLWHRQGKHFGLGSANGKVSVNVSLWLMLTCGALVVLSLLATR